MLDITQGLIELAAEVDFDDATADWFDVHEYLDDIPNPRTVLRDLIHHMHDEYL